MNPVEPENVILAAKFKEEANLCFKSTEDMKILQCLKMEDSGIYAVKSGSAKRQAYEKAINLYSDAIKLDPTVAVYYANRSFAYLKTECFGYALKDSTKSIELDKTYVKGYYRRAAAFMSLGKFKLALKDYETVTKARPNDKQAKLKYTECNKIVKKIAFEKAIAVDDAKKCIADTINIENMGKIID